MQPEMSDVALTAGDAIGTAGDGSSLKPRCDERSCDESSIHTFACRFVAAASNFVIQYSFSEIAIG
jgi:hypothetical protein